MVHYSDVVNAEVICFIILHLIRQELSILEGVCPLFSAEIRYIFRLGKLDPSGRVVTHQWSLHFASAASCEK